MSRLHLLILWILAIGAGLIFFNRNKDPEASTSETKLETGSSLFESNLVEKIDSVSIESDGKSITLNKADGNWLVAEKDNYPANLSNVTRVLDALRDAKVAQGVVASDEYYDRFNLDPDAEDENERPDVITLKQGEEEESKIFLGKPRESTGGNGSSAGRFIRLSGDDSGVYIVQEGFSFVGGDPENWIDKTLSPLEEGVIRLEVSAPNDDTFKSWIISRESVRDDFLVEGLGEKEETMTNVTGTLKNTFSRATFIELLSEEEAQKRADQKGIREVKATDSSGSTFLITITPEKKKEDDQEKKEDEPIPAINYIVTVEITGGPTVPEPPAEDADTQAKAVYAERVANLSDLSASIARMRKTYQGRHFLVNKGSIGNLLKNRGEFIQAKKVEKKPTTVATPPIRVPSANDPVNPTMPVVPGGTPPPLIARPKEDPKKKPPIEAVTPPIQVPPIKENEETPPPKPGSKPDSEAPEEPAKVEPAKVEPAKVEPAKVEPAKVEPAKVEPAKVEEPTQPE